MRQLTPEELELIVGASGTTTVNVTATGFYPTTTIPTSTHPVTSTPPDQGGGGGGGGYSGGTGQSTATCFVGLSDMTRVQKNTIYTNEGGVKTTGYTLPAAQFPRSGETIGAGVDLGYHTASELQSAGVSSTVATSLSHWYGHTSSTSPTVQQVDATYGHPKLTTTNATAVSDSVLREMTGQLNAKFNAASAYADFLQLPADTQTAIMDVTYQSGVNLASSAPTFWSDITHGHWSAAVYELQHWYSNGTSDTRHNSDASLIQHDITYHYIPKDDTGGFCH